MRIAVDAMGGDSGAGTVVAGVARFLSEGTDHAEVVLVGDAERIRRELEPFGDLAARVQVEHASEEIQMEEHGAAASRRKRNSSIAKGLLLHKEKKVDAFVSAGNTGAVVAASLLGLGRLPGLRRPAIATFVPNEKDGFVLLDIGATKDCRPTDLVQFAHMGAVYAERIVGREKPRVGLLSIGEEPTKGNDLTREAFPLLEKSGLSFAGNVEPVGMFKGEVDVVVCDGFVGNVILKFAEGMIGMILGFLKGEIARHPTAKIGAALLKPTLSHLKDQFSYEEYGGAPLLGIDGVVIICHGRSSPLAIANAVRTASRFVRYDMSREIAKRLRAYDEVTVE
ncbi:MAG: phosphate acyltransferase PlsX [Candidatus Eisenbacteria bacterium]